MESRSIKIIVLSLLVLVSFSVKSQDFQGKAYYFSKTPMELGRWGAKMSEQQKKHELFIDGRKQLDSLANAYNRATNEEFKKVYKQKWFELIKVYANKIERKK